MRIAPIWCRNQNMGGNKFVCLCKSDENDREFLRPGHNFKKRWQAKTFIVEISFCPNNQHWKRSFVQHNDDESLMMIVTGVWKRWCFLWQPLSPPSSCLSSRDSHFSHTWRLLQVSVWWWCFFFLFLFIYLFYFYRTHVHMGSDHWVAISVCPSLQDLFDLVKDPSWWPSWRP